MEAKEQQKVQKAFPKLRKWIHSDANNY